MTKQSIGREYQHLEDFLIDGGSKSVLQVADHLSKTVKNPELFDHKWDGSASIYWGRDNNGDFYFIPKNQWNKGQLLTKDELYDEILNTGRKQKGQSHPEFREYRQEFATELIEVWDMFEENTPQDFRGYLNGDLVFTKSLGKDLTVTPNKVKFDFDETAFNGRIKTAEVMVVVHGQFGDFGLETLGNISLVDDSVIDGFNESDELIVLNTQTPSVSNIDIEKKLNILKEYVTKNREDIDKISNFSMKGFTTLKSKLYSFSVSFGKLRDGITVLDWLKGSKVSSNQKQIIRKLSKTPEWDKFWAVYVILQSLKLDILTELFKNDTSMKDLGINKTINGFYGGEGFVTEMDNGQIIKLINPEFRYSDSNERFK